MKFNKIQIERLARGVLEELARQKIIEFKVPQDKAFKRSVELIQGEYLKEREVEKQAHQMVDDLERKNPGGFEKHKMFLMIKRKLAEDKKLVLNAEDRLTHFAHVITDGLYHDDLVDYTDDQDAIRAAKLSVRKFQEDEDKIDDDVRKKLLSLKRNVIEGSMEWDTLYTKYYDEELKRRGL